MANIGGRMTTDMTLQNRRQDGQNGQGGRRRTLADEIRHRPAEGLLIRVFGVRLPGRSPPYFWRAGARFRARLPVPITQEGREIPPFAVKGGFAAVIE